MGRSKVLFDSVGLSKVLFDKMVVLQTNLLIDYAKRKVNEIGQKIESYGQANHMNDTGNLLDSICWGVMYGGQIKGSGFYQEKTATRPSYLHGRSMVTFTDPIDFKTGKRKLWKRYRNDEDIPWVTMDAGEPVNGHELAEAYISKQEGKGNSGQWKVFFAILAPYWGYWEKGFTMKGRNSQTFVRFIVMSQFYDSVKSELTPAKTRIHVSVAKYASKSLYRQAKRNL